MSSFQNICIDITQEYNQERSTVIVGNAPLKKESDSVSESPDGSSETQWKLIQQQSLSHSKLTFSVSFEVGITHTKNNYNTQTWTPAMPWKFWFSPSQPGFHAHTERNAEKKHPLLTDSSRAKRRQPCSYSTKNLRCHFCEKKLGISG